MKNQKMLDCVEMKSEIQRKHLREVAELGEAEAERRRWQRVLNDPILSGFVRADATETRRRGGIPVQNL